MINVIMITHNEIGKALQYAASKTFGGKLPLPTTVVAITHDSDPEIIGKKLQQLVANLSNDQGILVLTDMFGSTPSNIAQRLSTNNKIKIVAGLNLPMLIRVMNYPKLSLAELAEKAVSGGREGVLCCDQALKGQ